jgi:hypothetical protein
MRKLPGFIRQHRDAIVSRWLAQVSELPSAIGQAAAVLRDHIPALLEQLAKTLEQGDANDGALDAVAGAHAALRFKAGYNLRQIVLEYQALRRTVLGDVFAGRGRRVDCSVAHHPVR